jgi:hypothetical protein
MEDEVRFKTYMVPVPSCSLSCTLQKLHMTGHGSFHCSIHEPCTESNFSSLEESYNKSSAEWYVNKHKSINMLLFVLVAKITSAFSCDTA